MEIKYGLNPKDIKKRIVAHVTILFFTSLYNANTRE